LDTQKQRDCNHRYCSINHSTYRISQITMGPQTSFLGCVLELDTSLVVLPEWISLSHQFKQTAGCIFIITTYCRTTADNLWNSGTI